MPRGGSNTGPCAKHNVTDCLACVSIVKTTTPLVPPVKQESVEPPDNIEGWLNDGKKADPVEAAIAKRVEPEKDPIVGTIPGWTGLKEPPPAKPEVSFDVLPVDDSHASKVTRAAAAYAKASADYAKAVVAVASLKIQLELEGAKLTKATEARIAAEEEMKKLMGGQA